MIMSDQAALPDTQNNYDRICFAKTFSSNSYMLLEVDEKIADDLLIHNKNYCIRGRKTDEVVLCSEDKTFKCTEVDISNTLVLLNDMPFSLSRRLDKQSDSHQIVSILSTYLEVTSTNPNVIFRINELLSVHKVNLFINPENIFANTSGITWSTLLSEVQISENELKQELLHFPTLLHNGKYFLMDQESVYELLDQIIELTTTKHIFSTNKLNLQMLQDNLPKQIPDDAIIWFLNKFCKKLDDYQINYYALDETAVSRTRAEQLLRNLKLKPEQQLNLDDFEQMVNNILPYEFRFREEHLLGLALINHTAFHGGKTLKRLLSSELPIDLNKRLSMLFSLKTAWKKEEIQPYISDYCSNPTKIDEFMLNFCRITGNASNRRYVYKQLL